MSRNLAPDLRFAALVAVAYLVARLAVWPMWDRPLAWQDFALAMLLGVAALAARWLREH